MKQILKSVQIGTVIEGTNNPQELIETFMELLDRIKEEISFTVRGERPEETEERKRTVEHIDDLLGSIETHINENDVYYGFWIGVEDKNLDCEYDLEELMELLNDFAPQFCCFGTHPGNGPDYGFWVSERDLEEARENWSLYEIQGVLAPITTGRTPKVRSVHQWERDDELLERIESGVVEYVLEVYNDDKTHFALFDALTREKIWEVI